MYKYKNLCYAGTFDHLHIGHKKMIDEAFKLAERVSIGITSDKMVRRKFLGKFVQELVVRRKKLEEYLSQKNYLKRAKFFVLNDIYGSSIKDNIFDSILVSESSKKNAEKINKIRKSKGLKELKIVVTTYILGGDREIITSERIRYGEIDRNGGSYKLQMANKKITKLILPEEMREELRRPLGKVFDGSIDQLSDTAERILHYINKMKWPLVVAVGDIIVKSLMDLGFEPEIKIIDFRSRRKEIIRDGSLEILSNDNARYRLSRLIGTPLRTHRLLKSSKQVSSHLISIPKKFISSVMNEAGTINIKAAKSINSTIKKFSSTGQKQWIIVKGEEDLLALPAILFAPLHSLVLYGQWNLGVVMVEVTEEKKKEVERILKKFL